MFNGGFGGGNDGNEALVGTVRMEGVLAERMMA